MKHYSLIVTLFTVITLSSCNEIIDDIVAATHHDDMTHLTYYDYNLSISFRDSTGKDLVKGMGLEELENKSRTTPDYINTDLFRLNIKLSSAKKNTTVMRLDLLQYDNNVSLFLNEYDDSKYEFVSHRLQQELQDYDFQDSMTYELTCPYIFGDEKQHMIKTWWTKSADDITKVYNDTHYNAQCTRITIDGRDVATPEFKARIRNVVTITL